MFIKLFLQYWISAFKCYIIVLGDTHRSTDIQTYNTGFCCPTCYNLSGGISKTVSTTYTLALFVLNISYINLWISNIAIISYYKTIDKLLNMTFKIFIDKVSCYCQYIFNKPNSTNKRRQLCIFVTFKNSIVHFNVILL